VFELQAHTQDPERDVAIICVGAGQGSVQGQARHRYSQRGQARRLSRCEPARNGRR
jgi:hypothetical protein